MTIPLVDNTSTGVQPFGVGTLTVAHTGAGSNRYLLAFGECASSADCVTGVTANGVAMTRKRAEVGGASAALYVYELVNPPTGAYNIVWTISNTTAEIQAIHASFTGVDQTTPSDANSGGNNSFQNSPRSDAIAVSAGGIAVDAIAGGSALNADPFVLGSGQTQIGQVSRSTGRLALSSLADATAMSWSWVGGQKQISHIVIALKAVAVPTTTVNCTVGTAAATGATASIQGTVTINATVGVAAATGSPATITNGVPTTTVNATVGTAAATGATAAVGTFIQTDQMPNNTGSILANTAVVWTWTPAGRIGSMAGLTAVDGTGTTDANGRLAPGIALATGRLDVAARNASAKTDDVFYQAF